MAALRNPKHEIVAQELAAGRTPEQASATKRDGEPIYDTSASSFAANARKRAQRKDIRKRVEEIRAPGVKRAENGAAITSEWMLNKLYRVANPDLGRKRTKVSDQIAALKLAAQLKGLLAPDKTALTDAEGNPLKVIHEVTWKQPSSASSS